jgi:hypothetical protein
VARRSKQAAFMPPMETDAASGRRSRSTPVGFSNRA